MINIFGKPSLDSYVESARINQSCKRSAWLVDTNVDLFGDDDRYTVDAG